MSRPGNCFSPKNKVLIVTEGHTEKIYLKHLKERYVEVELIIDEPPSSNTVLKLVKTCRRKMGEKGISIKKGDRAYCVTDVDKNKREDFEKAVEIAEKSGIVLIVSKPSIEVWFLMHYMRCIPKDIDARRAKDLLSECLGERYRETADYWDTLQQFQEIARENCEAIGRECAAADPMEIYEGPPYTNIPCLLDAIAEMKKRNKVS